MSMAEDDDAGRASEDKAALEYSLQLVISADELDSDSVNGALESDEAVSAGAVPSSELLDKPGYEKESEAIKARLG